MADRRVIATISVLVINAALGNMAQAGHVPSLPSIAREFFTTLGAVQLTVTVYLVAFATGMLIVGPLSDQFGRRRVLIGAISLYVLASAACTVAPGLGTLLAARVAQALGASAGMAVGRAIVRDLFDSTRAAQAMSAVAMTVSFASISAPALGGIIESWVGWRYNFAYMCAMGTIAVTLTALVLPETNRSEQPQSAVLATMLASFATLFRSRAFIGYVLAVTTGASSFSAYITGGSVVVIDTFGVSPDRFGIYASLVPVGFLVGGFLSNRLVRRFGIDQLITVGTCVSLSGGVIMGTLSVAGVHEAFAVIAPMFLVTLGNGLTMPNAFSGMVSINPRIAGAASGLAGAIQMTAAAAVTVVVTFLPRETALPVALVIVALGLMGVGGFRYFRAAGRT